MGLSRDNARDRPGPGARGRLADLGKMPTANDRRAPGSLRGGHTPTPCGLSSRAWCVVRHAAAPLTTGLMPCDTRAALLSSRGQARIAMRRNAWRCKRMAMRRSAWARMAQRAGRSGQGSAGRAQGSALSGQGLRRAQDGLRTGSGRGPECAQAASESHMLRFSRTSFRALTCANVLVTQRASRFGGGGLAPPTHRGP